MNLNNFKPERVLEELEKGDFGGGDLALFIACTKCGANFDLNRESITLAIMGRTTLIDYIRYVQHSKCPECNESDIEIVNKSDSPQDDASGHISKNDLNTEFEKDQKQL
jgi:hypothetical protein